MPDDQDQLRAELLSLPDQQLFDIIAAAPDQYRPEALQIARDELARRRVDLTNMKPTDLTPDTDILYEPPEEPGGQIVRRLMPSWWFWVCLATGLGILLSMYRIPQVRQGKPAIYTITIAMDLIALADWNRFVKWRQQSQYWKLKYGGFAVVASFLTVWSFLCLLNIINYSKYP